MTNNKKTLYAVRFDTGSAHEVSEDFSLPDYMPEVRQIISCSASVLPENKYIDQNEVTLSGLVTYTVLYVGDDGKLSAAPLNSEYTVKLSCAGAEMSGLSQDMIMSSTSLTSTNCRATGPRRLMLISRMYSKIFSALGTDHSENITVSSADGDTRLRTADELSLERHTAEIDSSNISCHSATGSLSGDIRERDGAKAISCGASAGVTSVSFDGRDIVVRGDAYISCLFIDTDGEYSTVRVKSPFEEKLTTESPSHTDDEKKSVSASVRCASVSMGGGDGGVFTWDMEYDIDVVRSSDHIAAVTDDIYSTEYETVTEAWRMPSVKCLKNGNSRLSISGTKQVTGGSEKRICHTSGRASVDRAECTPEGKLTVSGSCTVQVIMAGDGKVSAEEVTLPVKFECDCKMSEGTGYVICDAGVMYTDSRLDGDKLTVDAELNLTLFAYAVQKTECVAACTIDHDAPVGIKGSCVKIYFPEENEELWDIGKKYHCPSDKITPLGSGEPVIIAK